MAIVTQKALHHRFSILTFTTLLNEQKAEKKNPTTMKSLQCTSSSKCPCIKHTSYTDCTCRSIYSPNFPFIF
ncbi:hypothetical protein BVRB_6g129960 [Beta vulgaris subsp. vulgaris]|nr:hypothetical protein BVRB_6g129960 [Beta vulgaris subsp. vulgaris]